VEVFGPVRQLGFSIFRLAFLVLLGLVATPSYADGPIIRDNDEQGNYEIDFSDYCSDRCKLQESTNFGSSWVELADHNYSPNIPNFVVTNKPNGTYLYRVLEEEWDWEDQERYFEYSAVQEVIVGPVAQPPTLEEQLEYEYEVRVGDINFDGLKDVFLDRITSAPANNGTLKAVILKQVSVGTFETLVPNTPQLSAAATWPLTAIDVLMADVNLDGFADVRLDGLANEIAGVYDQIIYSPAVAYTGIARNVRPIDPAFEAFASDLIGYYLDEEYFTDRATQTNEPGDWEEELDCELEWRGLLGWEWICQVEYSWDAGGVVTTYPGVHDSAVAIWEDANSAFAGQLPWDSVVGLLANQLGVDIQIGPWCVRVGGGSVSSCSNEGMSQSVLSLFLLLKHSKSPKGRALDTVYLTAHKVAFIGPLHVALEYSRNFQGAVLRSWTSAAPSGFLTSGYLNNDLSRIPDSMNFTVTTVTSPSYPIAIWHWDAIFEGHLKYENDCIPYEATAPWLFSPPFPQGEFNSNSYVAGLIELTGSFLTTGSMSDFVLGQNPVPNEFYTDATPCGQP
tara:strand:- start:551 stop:2242 length:1692 start_codon:yes stop_codon:yes gene_type:complete